VIGRAFRSPSVYELYYNDGGITQLPAEKLEPETIWNGEIEHTHAIGTRSFVLASLFASRIYNLIDLTKNADDILIYANADQEIVDVGAEVEVRVTARGGGWGSFALSGADEADSLDNLFGRGAPAGEVERLEWNSAAVVGSLRGFWPVLAERLGLAAELVYNSPRPRRDGTDAGPALLGRVFASGRLRSTPLLYRFGVTNLLDWDWGVPVGEEFRQESIRQEPRTFHVQLVYELP
jgi:outer membrane receptor protein involved in Fe transport